MIPRLTDNGVEFITTEECERDWRALLEAAERLNCTKDGVEKVIACMTVFGRCHTEVLVAVRSISRQPSTKGGN